MRAILKLALAGVASMAISAGATAQEVSDRGWVTTWTTALLKPTFVFSNPGNYGFENRTLRMTALTSSGGSKVRVRLTNRHGKTPLVIGKAAIGPRHKPFNADLVQSHIRTLTFGGQAGVTIPPGGDIVSDAVAMEVLPSQVLGVDVFLPQKTGAIAYNFATATTSYSAEGDRAGSASGKGFEPTTSWYVVEGIEVENPKSVGTIVACCDSVSITGQVDAGMRWPEILSREMRERWGDRAPSIVQTTLSGQRLLTSSHYAESSIARFERDVLNETNVKAVLLFVGVNDLGVPQMPPVDIYSPTNDVTAEEMIDGFKRVVAMARARDIPIFGATIAPGSGYVHLGSPYWSPAQEVKRRKINAWLRSTDIFDKVFDFAAAVQNPLDEEYYRPGASTDNIHPSDSGQYLIAKSIDEDLVMKAAERAKPRPAKP